MKIRLQHVVEAFGETALNGFDLEFWKAATDLVAFGVELRMREGYARVELRHYTDESGPTVLATLEQSGPGSAYSPPFFPADMAGGVILPVIVEQSRAARFTLYFGTNDLPPMPRPKIAFVTGGAGAAAHRAAFEEFLANAHHQPGDAPALILAGAGAPDRPGVFSLPPDATAPAPFSRAAFDITYGALAGQNFSHLCAFEPEIAVHPEMFARITEILRFLKPGFHAAAALHPANGAGKPGKLTGPSGSTGMSDPAWPLDHAGAGVALRDIAACNALARQPEQALPGMIALSLQELRRFGLPNPGFAVRPMLEYAARLAGASSRPAVPLSLAVFAEAGTGGESQRAALTEAFTALAASGKLGDAASLRSRAKALSAAGAAPDDMLAALADVLQGPARAPQAAPQATPRKRGLGIFARRGNGSALDAALDTLLAAPVDFGALTARHAAAHAEACSPLARLTGQSENDAIPALWSSIVATHQRLDSLRTEMMAMNAALGEGIEARLHHTGIGDPARTRADLFRASGLAIAALKDRHRGQRAVIVGNGPSLRISDLERLSGAVSFASNKIFLAFGETGWRPDYYSVEDHLVLGNNFEAISGLRGVTKIFPENMRDHGYHSPDTIFIHRIPPASWDDPLSDPAFPGFSLDLVEGLHWGSTIVYSQIQMAVHMGCSEIYLIGVDHSYSLPGERRGNTYVSEGEQNHFHGEYHKAGELWHQPNLEVLEVSYRKAHTFCAELGIPVLNASRKTRLETVPTVDFDTIFPA